MATFFISLDRLQHLIGKNKLGRRVNKKIK